MSTPTSKRVVAKEEDEDSFEGSDYLSEDYEDEEEGEDGNGVQGQERPGFMPEQGLIKGALQAYHPTQVSFSFE